MANLAHVTITKPAGALVSITRRPTDSNTVAVTVNKSTAVTAQNEGTAPTGPAMTGWRAGAWR